MTRNRYQQNQHRQQQQQQQQQRRRRRNELIQLQTPVHISRCKYSEEIRKVRKSVNDILHHLMVLEELEDNSDESTDESTDETSDETSEEDSDEDSDETSDEDSDEDSDETSDEQDLYVETSDEQGISCTRVYMSRQDTNTNPVPICLICKEIKPDRDFSKQWHGTDLERNQNQSLIRCGRCRNRKWPKGHCIHCPPGSQI